MPTRPSTSGLTGGTLNASYNCLDRHVDAGIGDRVAFHWRGEDGRGARHHLRAAAGEVKRFANALKDLGVSKGDVVGIYLPMIPEVVVAMLACARIGAPHNVVFGGFSAEAVRERMEFSEAKAADHRRRRRAQGQTAPVKDRVDEVMGDLAMLQRIVVVRSKGTPCQMNEGRDVYYDEIVAAAEAECPAEPLGRRAPALHPLHVGLDGQAEGHPAHDGRLPDGRLGHPPLRLRPEAGVRRLLVRGRRRLGHRALLHRLRTAVQRRHVGDVGGRAGLPRTRASGGSSSSATA